MTGRTSIIALLAVVLAAAAIWFGFLRQPAEMPGGAPTTEAEAAGDATGTGTTGAQDEAAREPLVDTENWICTAWTDASGAVVTTGEANAETCTQWTVRRGASTE